MADDPRDLNVLLRERSTRDTDVPPVRPVFIMPGSDQEPAAAPRPAAAATRASDDTDDTAPRTRRGATWLNALLALVAVGGAVVALTAPSLRPVLVERAPAVLGQSVSAVLADVLTPESLADRAVADMLPRMIALEAEVLRLRMEIGNLTQLAVRADARATENEYAVGGTQAAAADAVRRVGQLETAAQALTDRVSAATLLAAATRLRRDIDGGGALADTIALLELNGPYPAAVATAIATLRATPDGVPSMRDLAVAYHALDQAISAEIGLDGSPWWRIRSLFGSSEDPRLSFLERARTMAADGRMTEVATMFTHSPWRDQAASWIERVAERTAAVRAAQAITSHALTLAQSVRPQPTAAHSGTTPLGTARPSPARP